MGLFEKRKERQRDKQRRSFPPLVLQFPVCRAPSHTTLTNNIIYCTVHQNINGQCFENIFKRNNKDADPDPTNSLKIKVTEIDLFKEIVSRDFE